VNDVETVLTSIPMFAHLGTRQRSRLAQHFCRRAYPPGGVIVRQGDTSMSFYVVLSGRVRVVRHAAGVGGAGDGALDIVEEGPGSFFGEMGVIDDLPRAATVMAVEPTECALLAKWDFQRELSADPGIALSLISVLNARIRTLEDRLTATGGS
jgi:CRP/FNR family cyclic AMP-dependent transcriptional regulator